MISRQRLSLVHSGDSHNVGSSVGSDGHIRALVKRLRASQPLNWIVTSGIKTLLQATRRESESIIQHVHRVGMVQSKLPNERTLKLWSLADDWVSNQVFWRGWQGYEPETVSLFFRLASRSRVTLDVGAYVGFYSLLAAHANNSGKVYSFEPLNDVCERLQKNVDLNELRNVQVFNSAVGAIDGVAEFFSTATNMPCSSSLSYDFMKSADGVYSLPVPVITLDKFVIENYIACVDLVKIDTESTEPDVVQGMVETLKRDQPFIVCEVLGRGSESKLEEVLRPLGYNFYLLTPDGPVLRDHIAGHPAWLNYLFTPLTPDEVSKL